MCDIDLGEYKTSMEAREDPQNAWFGDRMDTGVPTGMMRSLNTVWNSVIAMSVPFVSDSFGPQTSGIFLADGGAR